jgi:hypothetical protein
MIARMGDLPLAVFAADWTLLTSTSLWRALFGSSSATGDPGQNLIIQTFIDGSTAEVATPHGGADAFERALVADLRRTAARLADAPRFRSFIADVRAQSPHFAELWDEGRAAAHQSLVKTVHNPLVGDIILDGVVTVPDSDIKLVVYTTSGNSDAAEKLDFLQGLTRAMRAARW